MLNLKYRLVLVLLLIAYSSFSQVTGSTTVCPNEEVSYSDNNAPNGTATWSVTGGTFTTTSSGTNLKTVKVKWNNTTTQGIVKITVPVKDQPSYTKSINVGIRSVNGYTPKPIRAFKGPVEQPITNINGNLTLKVDWCESSSYTLYTQHETFPNTITPIDGHLWQVPAGWQITSNNGSWINGKYETHSDYITVVPLKGNGGNTVNQIKVQAYSLFCNYSYNGSNLHSYVSNERVVYVEREPQLGTIAASKTNLHCGDRSPVNFSVAAVTGATSYTWTLPQGWTISGSASGNSISAIPSGTGGGQVSVAANLTCTTPTKSVNSAPITINYNSSLPAPVFSSAPDEIGNLTAYSVAPVAGATGYTWEASPNILINGQVSPLQSTSTAVTISQRPGHSGAGWVRVTAASAQCGSSSVTKNVWVGVPEIIGFRYYGSSAYPACPLERITFEPIYNGYQGRPLRYRWSASNVISHSDLAGATLNVMAEAFNYSSRMIIGLEVETAIGWTQKWVMEYEIRDCDNGAEPWFAPNPVTGGEITIEVPSSSEESYSYTLFDLQGNQRLSGKAQGKKTKVSTKGIPAGTYMLRLEHNGKSTTKRMIVEK